MTQATKTYTPEDMAEYARQARVRILEAVKHAGGGHVGIVHHRVGIVRGQLVVCAMAVRTGRGHQ